MLLVSAVILYKEHLVKYFCHLALAHVQYNLYDNVFAFLCPSPPSAHLLAHQSRQWDLVGEGACPCLPWWPCPLLVSIASSQAFSGLRVCSQRTWSVRGVSGRWEEGREEKAPSAPSHNDSSVVVTFRQNFVVFSLLWPILIKMQNRV